MQQRDRATVSQNRHTARRVYIGIIAFSVSSFRVVVKGKRSPGSVLSFFHKSLSELTVLRLAFNAPVSEDDFNWDGSHRVRLAFNHTKVLKSLSFKCIFCCSS